MSLTDDWPTEIGQCLNCGGRGGAPGVPVCRRCDGTGEDPARHEQWFLDLCAPEQIDAQMTKLLRAEP